MPVAALRALTGAATTGTPLPRVPELNALYQREIEPRQGEMVMIAGKPKSGKSAFALWWAAKMGLKTLYFSADTNRYQAASRLAALLSGHTVNAVRECMDNGYVEPYQDALAGCPIQFCFDSSPDLTDLADELNAYVELWDEYPELIVVDNLINVQSDNENEWQGLRYLLTELHSLVRLTNSTLFVLHHMSEAAGEPTEPAPAKALHGKVSQLPEWVLSVAANSMTGEFKVANVAARSAPCDPTGKSFVTLRSDLARSSFGPWVGNFGYYGYGSDDE